jgi:hypothetical protein
MATKTMLLILNAKKYEVGCSTRQGCIFYITDKNGFRIELYKMHFAKTYQGQ